MDNSFQFGVEIELLLSSRKKHSTWKSLAGDLSKRLQRAGIRNRVDESNAKSPDGYREWFVVPEVSIPSQPAKNLWGVELVSPVYRNDSSSCWALDLEAVFAAVFSAYSPVSCPNCSTHVHVSRAPVPLDASELAALAAAALYFERALDHLATDRCASASASGPYWCQSNRVSPSLRRLPTLRDCLLAVDRAVSTLSGPNPLSASTRPVVELMNLVPASSAYGRSHGKTRDFLRGKVYKWNLDSMATPAPSSSSPSRRTVEFRQPPGSLNAGDAAAWVSLTLTFVAGAVLGAGSGFSLAAAYAEAGAEGGGSVAELWGLLASGAEALGWDGLGGVEGLFGANVAE